MAHHEDIFAVDSQIELLNTINKHTKDGSKFIGVEGNKGSGKSWLAQSYLVIDEDETLVQALLICNESQTAAQQRDIIIGQLLPTCIIEDDAIIDCLVSYRDDKVFNATIIIDNVEFLQEDVLQELSQVVLNAQGRDNWRINTILFVQPSQLTNILAEVEIKPELLMLKIDVFSDEEKEQFVEAIVFPELPNSKAETRVRDALPQTPPYPANLIDLGLRNKKERLGWIRPFLIAVLVVVVILGWLSSWYNNYNSDTDTNNPVVVETPVANQQAAGGTSEYTSSASVSETDNSSETSGSSETGNTLAEDEWVTESPEIDEPEVDEPKVDEPEVKEPVVIRDASIDLPPVIGGAPETQKPPTPSNVASNNTQAPSTDQASAVEEANTAVETPKKPASKPQTNASSQLTLEQVLSQWDNRRLMNLSERRYTLQIGAFGNSQNALAFIAKHQLQNGRIHSTKRNGKLLYIVTYKDFVTAKDAQAAISELPESVLTEKPWAKSILSVHNDIKQTAE